MSDNNIIYDIDGGRLPYSVSAEQAVLGSMISDPECINEVAVQVRPEYFYIPQHKDIYTAISSMYEFSQSIDFISLLERLKKDGVYDEAGGKEYLTRLVQTVPSSANVMTYVAIIREQFYRRALMGAAKGILKDIDENAMDSGKLLESAEQRIFEIRDGREIGGLTHIKDVISAETYDRLTKINDPETRNDYIGIPTGIGELDRITTGLNKSDLIILGARPGMGKTSFALNIARNVAVNAGKTVCFFSLEMSRDQLAQRMLSSEAAIKSEKLRTGDLAPEEWTRLTQAGENLSKAEIYFDETSDITVPQMMAKLRRMEKCDLVVIDYLGLMNSAEKKENRVNEVSDITRSLKKMAKKLKVPVIACAQLSRATETKGKSHKPMLADLRDSGSIEQDADIVLFLYREAYYDSEKASDEDKADTSKSMCIVAKNRHGEANIDVPLYWDGQHTRFMSVDGFR